MNRTSPLLVSVLLAAGACNAQRVLQAHPMPWQIPLGSDPLLLFDLQALHDPVVIEGFTTAMNNGAGYPLRVNVLIREGTALGGTATSGPGYSMDGWTDLGFANGMQGPVGGGLSLPVAIPRFVVRPGHVVGVALDVYSGDFAVVHDTGSHVSYEDGALRITTGDVRNPAFAPTQHYYPYLQLVGSIIYELAPCYPNCDASTASPALNVNDFLCFMGKFAAGDSYANCDQSTTPPILSVNDFLCFTQQFAGGCS